MKNAAKKSPASALPSLSAQKNSPSPVAASPQVPVPPDTRELPLHDTIAERAYTLWLDYGQPEGRADEIWLEAERQLLGADRQVNRQDQGAVSARALSTAVEPAMINRQQGQKLIS